MSSLLETTGLTVTFGGLNANDNVDIEITKGSFVGLIAVSYTHLTLPTILLV